MMPKEYELAFYEWYARYLWPVHRIFCRRTLAKRCSSCSLPETHTPLTRGMCPFCALPRERSETITPEIRKKMTREIDEIFFKYQGKGKGQYDCLVLFSGGKDSIYLLHELQQKYPGLRLLTLFVDNSFIPPVSLENAKQVAHALNVPFMSVHPEPSFYEKCFRHAFLNLNGRQTAVVVDQFDGDILHDIARNIAAQFSIPLIASGVQSVQVERYIGIQHYETTRSFEESKRTHVADLELASFLTPQECTYFWDGTRWPKRSIPRMLFPFYAWEYSEDTVMHTIHEMHILPKKRLSPLATNHALLPLMGAVDITRFGYSSYDPEFADLIRAGGADKGFWTAILEMQEYSVKKNRFITQSIDAALARLSLTRKDLGLVSLKS